MPCTDNCICDLNVTYPEVVGVNVQFLRVQDAQLCVGFFDVVHVLHGSVQSMQHCDAVFSDHWVPHDGSRIVQVSKLAEVPLSPWVHDKTPKSNNGNIFITTEFIIMFSVLINMSATCDTECLLNIKSTPVCKRRLYLTWQGLWGRRHHSPS